MNGYYNLQDDKSDDEREKAILKRALRSLGSSKNIFLRNVLIRCLTIQS